MSGKCAGKICENDAQGRPRACNASSGRCKLVAAKASTKKPNAARYANKKILDSTGKKYHSARQPNGSYKWEEISRLPDLFPNLYPDLMKNSVTQASSGLIVNASDRFLMKNGVKVTQAVPKNPKSSRGAPAGHAANYAGQTARGLDGKLWESRKLNKIVRQNGKPSYRWKKLA